VLTAAGVPVGPINDIGQAFDLAKRLELDAVVDMPGSTVSQVANPIRMSATPVQYRSAPPRLGS
jgi:crotonobetainyl-CoA:carnitine CoA-transferase CaiB-like acyl-CoA transferase